MANRNTFFPNSENSALNIQGETPFETGHFLQTHFPTLIGGGK